MHSFNSPNNNRDYSLHLTVQSGEFIKSSLTSASKMSISCEISDIPSMNCTLIFSEKEQHIGPIGSIKFEENRPIAVAKINLGQEAYAELHKLLCNPPPRPASIYLLTSKFPEDNRGIINVKKSGLNLDISDLSWRYPIL